MLWVRLTLFTDGILNSEGAKQFFLNGQIVYAVSEA